MRNWKDDATNVILFGYIIFILCALICLCSCNPVKQVLKDKEKLDKVAEVVVKSGYCANDTTIITKSDTTIQYDTTYETQIQINEKTDTIRIPKVITRTITIRDTIKSVVVDNSRVQLLQKEIEAYKESAYKLREELLHWKELAKKRWWNLWGLIILFSIYILRKPILKLINVAI
jgi:hypothetical protein